MVDLASVTQGLSMRSQGKEAALLLPMGVLGVTAGSISPPSSAVILQDAAELYSRRRFPGRDTAARHGFT